ncbi:MAG: CvpA family protein [Rhodothermales bacterium]
MGDLPWLDVGIGLVVGLGVWRGLRTGALRQLVGTVGLVVALFAGALLMRPVGDLVVGSLGLADRLAPLLGFVVTFAAVLGAAAVVAQLLKKTLVALRLGALDRVAGAGVGGLRAALGLSVLLLLTGPLVVPGRGGLLFGTETREKSVLYEPVRALAPLTWDAFRFVLPGLQTHLADAFAAGGGAEQ